MLSFSKEKLLQYNPHNDRFEYKGTCSSNILHIAVEDGDVFVAKEKFKLGNQSIDIGSVLWLHNNEWVLCV